jgi:hypothetical protein
MDCPKCKTYNPEDRDKCWRCDAPLPRPVEKKKKDPRAKNQVMMYVLIAALLLFSLLQMCNGGQGNLSQSQTTPTGYAPPTAPPAEANT